MRVTFHGATDTVTGSRFLVEAGRSRVLVDCGMFQGLKQLRLRNRAPFPVDPSSIDAVVVTHAHLDHSGHLPALVRDGFRGPVLCTPLTAQLLPILLRDAAHIAEEDARFHARRGSSRHARPEPVSTAEDAEAALRQLRPVDVGRTVDAAPDIRLTLTRVGHILGAASAHLVGDGVSIAFTGDVGRPDDPVMLPPEPLLPADVVVTESTYGDRSHGDVDPASVLAEVVTRTVERGGTVVVPSFAVGRAQALLHLLAELRGDGRIPDVPVHLNSPMATTVTELFLRSRGEHRLDEAQCRAMWSDLQVHRSVDESKRLTALSGPRVVITASGMVTGGRVLHHLLRSGPDPASTILLPGFQAAGTRGRQLQHGAESVRIFGADVPIRAEVVTLPAMSAHADADELVAFLGRSERPHDAFAVHGEPEAADALRLRLARELGWRAAVPALGDTVEVQPR